MESKKSVTGKAFDFILLKRIFSFTRPYKITFYLCTFLTIFLAFVSPVRPWLIQYTFDNFIVLPNPQMLLNMTLIMITLLIIQGFAQYYQVMFTNWLGQSIIRDLRVKLFTHINNFRLKYFDQTPIGTLVTRTISDMETIADIFSEGLITILGDILQLVVVIAVMFFTDWRLTLISLSTLPLLMVATNVFKNGIKSSFNEVRTQVAHLNTFVQEHLTGMSVVQVFNREEAEFEKFKEINNLHRKAHIRSVWYYSVFFPVVEVLSAASIGMMVWWGSKGVILHQVTLGNMVAFIMYINMLFRPIRELADKFNTLQMGMVSSERIFKVLDTDALISNNGTLYPTEINGEIVFEDVWFAYNNEDWVLKGISFKVAPGQMVALVGATGAGKSSIINLLGRFYEINKGRISIDGVDIRDFELGALRQIMAVVLQDVFLFSDTIANNISLQNSNITRTQIIEAAEAIGADKFIQNLPGDYDYSVGERGATLSTGQRQLISFVRACVHNPKILVLDEATSSIDTESEELIHEATAKLTQNRSSIIIAHRLATIQNASKIIVLDHGMIIEEGLHQELLQKNGHYRALYEIQFKEAVSQAT